MLARFEGFWSRHTTPNITASTVPGRKRGKESLILINVHIGNLFQDRTDRNQPCTYHPLKSYAP
jgi:hypothetical protein